VAQPAEGQAADQPPGGQPPVWGAPASASGPRWSGRKIAAAVAVALGIAAGGGAAIYAASSLASDGGAGANAQSGPGGPMGGPGGMAGSMGGMFGTDHGEFQTGKVTAVSSGSITVASDDGYSKTYAVNSSTEVDGGNDQIGSVRNGETVTVVATASGDTATATSILDQTLARQNGGFGGGPAGGQRQDGGQGGSGDGAGGQTT
jgi:hypothetical protein